MSKEGLEQFALGHKKGKNSQIQKKNTNFLRDCLFFANDLLEHEQITHNTLF